MDFLKGSTLRKKLIKFSAREPPLRFVSIATFGEIEGNQDKIKLTPTLPPSKHIGSLGALCAPASNWQSFEPAFISEFFLRDKEIITIGLFVTLF